MVGHSLWIEAAILPITGLALSGLHAAGPPCAQADARSARSARLDSLVTITGAGSSRADDGTFTIAWTGRDCIAWVRVRGAITVDSTWNAVSVSPNAEFVAHDEGPWGRRDYLVSGSGARALSVDGNVVPASHDDEAWVAVMVREYVRRSGAGASTRAGEIVARGGVSALLAEVREIGTPDVRVRYLPAGFARVDEPGRAAFIHDGAALLDHAFGRAAFLFAIPAAWRGDERVLAAAYTEGALIEPDDLVEQLLRTMPPPRPTPPALRPLIERLIASLQSRDRRNALRSYYLDLKPAY